MELKKVLKQLSDKMGKYKYAMIVLAIGLGLMIVPTHSQKAESEVPMQDNLNDRSCEEYLSEVLSHVDGVGSVKVMLSIQTGEQTIYQSDESCTKGTDSVSETKKTVILSSSSKNQEGLVIQKIPAIYQGAIVVCQGADKPEIRLEITEAVSKITGLGTDRIVVLKMK